MKIIICLPGSSFCSETMLSIIELTHHMRNLGITPIISCKQSPVIYYVRNMCLGADNLRGKNQTPFNGADYDYTLWIDSDIVFKPDDFNRLLYWKKDIISGLYKMSDNKNYATCLDWNIEQFKQQGYFNFINDEIYNSLDKSKPIDVAYTGFGFMLIKRGVFESLGYPFFKPRYFELPEINFLDFSSEDCSFCLDAKEKGFNTYVDANVIVGHKKSFVI